jgi:phenylacetate-CoA ligase
MRFLIDKERIYAEKAFFYYIWSKYGYRIGERCIFIKGDKVADHDKRRYWKYDPLYNYLRFDSDYLNQQDLIVHYDKKIRRFGARVLFGFPSSIYQLALMYHRSPLDAPTFDLILLASENTYDDQNEFLKKVFSCKKVFFHYGHSEYAALAWKETGTSRMGFVPTYGYTELLNPDGSNALPGGVGEITATGYNLSMPFIRYRTNDFAVRSNSPGSGRLSNALMVDSIEGRLQEYIVTRDGRLVSICTMGAAHFEEFSELIETQYYQNKPGYLALKVVAKVQLDNLTKQAIASVVEDKLESSVKVEVVQVDSIGRLKSDKKSMIDQQLDVSIYL